MRNFDNHLDLHTRTEWDLRRAKRAAGMRAALAKDFQKKFGGAIGDLVRFGKAWSAVHQYQQPDNTFHPVQIVQGTVQCREEFDGDITRCLPTLSHGDFLPQFAGEWLATFLRESSRQINKIAGSHKGHKQWHVAIGHWRRNFR